MWFWETSKVFLGLLQMLRSSIEPGLILLMYLQSSTPSAMASNTDIEFGFIASHLARSGSPVCVATLQCERWYVCGVSCGA